SSKKIERKPLSYVSRARLYKSSHAIRQSQLKGEENVTYLKCRPGPSAFGFGFWSDSSNTQDLRSRDNQTNRPEFRWHSHPMPGRHHVPPRIYIERHYRACIRRR